MSTAAADLTDRRLSGSAPLVDRLDAQRGARHFPDPETLNERYLDDYEPHAKQREMYDERHCRRMIVVAGRRSGKTFGTARSYVLPRVAEDYREWLNAGGSWERPSTLDGTVKPALHYWIVAPTYDLVDYPAREIFDVLGSPESSEAIIKYERQERRLWLAGGILLEFRSADRPERLVSAGLDGVWVEEAARVKRSTWTKHVYPTLADKGGWAVLTTTPRGKGWVYDQWQRTDQGHGDRQKGWKGLHFTTLDNTAVPRLVEEAKRAREELPTEVWRREYAADFTSFEGQIFQAYSDTSPHVVSQIPWPEVELRIGGIDWGFHHPGASVEIAISPSSGWYVYSEEYERRLTVTSPGDSVEGDCWIRRWEHAERLRDVSRWWADPSDPEHIDQCQRNGLSVRKANNSVRPGISAVSAMLEPVPTGSGTQAPVLQIHRGCSRLRRELGSYKFQEDSEKPVKEDDHTVDALRYAVLSEHQRGGGISHLADWSIFEGQTHEAAA